tara:strand:- start:13146 stop:13367 length:222 start_codon:yes stop_codon:yes gene_type:complete
MSGAQEIIERNFEQLCIDTLVPLGMKHASEEKEKLYKSIREFVYEFMYDSSTLEGVEEEAEYVPNYYDLKWRP